MQYYVINKLDNARVVFLNGRVTLQPKGQKGDTRRLPAWARNHPDVTSLEKRGRVEVLDEAKYRARLGHPVRPEPVEDDVPVVTPEPAPVVEEVEEAPVVTPEPAPVVEEEEEVEEEETSSTPADLHDMDTFADLKAGEQREYLEGLGIDGDFGNEAKRLGLYEEYLESVA
jgi:hypothetical protein